MNNQLKKSMTKNWFRLMQETICQDIEEIENKKKIFRSKNWKRGNNSDEGGGEIRLFENGKIFEKVGVNFSEVYGKFSKDFRKSVPGTDKKGNFWASGVSVVMHMKNPHIPAMHFNTRYIFTSYGWFGGGMDVTPCLKDIKLKKWFHNELKKTCNKHNKFYYPKYKKWCDNYFFLPHRNESRGIGGIFFDYKKNNFEKDFRFVRDVGLSFKNIFNGIIKKKYLKKWGLREKEAQYIKRGRYVEFNLLYDRGTKFGLKTGGNTEGILMSLPPIAKWK